MSTNSANNSPEKEVSVSDLQSDTLSNMEKHPKVNFAREWYKFHSFGLEKSKLTECRENVICQRYKYFKVFNSFVSFTSRVTCLAWHPTRRLLVAGSKGGEASLYSLEDDLWVIPVTDWDGGGAGYSVLSCTFPDFLDGKALLARHDGALTVHDLEHSNEESERCIVQSTDCVNQWYCSVSSSSSFGIVLAGNNRGGIAVLDKRLQTVQPTFRAHKGKVNSIDFDSTSQIFATASGDHTVKVWDVRKLGTAVQTMEHQRAVNSAYFRGPLLLTTDQGSELRVYVAPAWHHRTIFHPHRQFQHLTPIRAAWHPLADLVLVGRYPDPRKPTWDPVRAVDVFSANSGQQVAQLHSAMVPGITSLVQPDPYGDVLACASGRSLVFWKFFDPLTDKYDFGKRSLTSKPGLPSSKRKRKRISHVNRMSTGGRARFLRRY